MAVQDDYFSMRLVDKLLFKTGDKEKKEMITYTSTLPSLDTVEDLINALKNIGNEKSKLRILVPTCTDGYWKIRKITTEYDFSDPTLPLDATVLLICD